jgi:hypothetical protein
VQAVDSARLDKAEANETIGSALAASPATDVDMRAEPRLHRS